MIIDQIKNAHLYRGLGPHIDAALSFLQEGDLGGTQKLSLDNGNVTVTRTDYTSRPCDQCKKETHYVYADIHVCLEGVEVFGYNNVKYMRANTAYDEEADKIFFDGPMNYIRLLPGMFALTLPEDVHSAMMMDSVPAPASKLIIKCKL